MKFSTLDWFSAVESLTSSTDNEEVFLGETAEKLIKILSSRYFGCERNIFVRSSPRPHSSCFFNDDIFMSFFFLESSFYSFFHLIAWNIKKRRKRRGERKGHCGVFDKFWASDRFFNAQKKFSIKLAICFEEKL